MMVRAAFTCRWSTATGLRCASALMLIAPVGSRAESRKVGNGQAGEAELT